MSHSKRSFVQAVMARLCPKAEQRDQALRFAEGMWAFLVDKGYGPPEPAGPRQSTDWYGKLVEPQKSRFDRFWAAYGHKVDRNGAAMRWHQLGDISESEADAIIHAAAAANRQWRETAQTGQVRKMAQGWLHERRWRDFEPAGNATPGPIRRDGDAELRGLRQQLGTLKRLHDLKPSDELQRQMDDLVKKIGNFHRRLPP